MSDKKKRNLFFLLLATLFFITASLLIPYSVGYRFSRERGIFIFTGSVTLNVTPRDISLEIDGEPTPKGRLSFINGSYHIAGLNPGEHQIRVSSAGFKPWNKKIGVSSGISTEFWNVSLVRDTYPRTRYQTPDIENFFYDAQKNLAAYVEKDESVLRISVLDINNESSENIFNSDDYRFTEDSRENIEWSPELFKVIIPVVKDGAKNYFVVDTDTKASLDLAEFSGSEDLRDVRWDPNSRNYVYLIDQNDLYRMNINDAQDKRLIASQISSYDFSGNKVFYLQIPSGIIFSVNPDRDISPIQITSESPDEPDLSRYRITIYDERRIALLNPGGKLYVYNDGEKEKYFRKLSDQAERIQFSDDGKKLLFSSEWEISVYFLRDWKVQPFRTENEIKEITRFSEKLTNVQWSKDYEHVTFLASGSLKIIEIDHRDQKNLTDITSVRLPFSKAVNDFPDDKLYFMDQDEDGKSYLFSIDFPEKETLF